MLAANTMRNGEEEESPFMQIGDQIFFTLSSVAPKLDGFLTAIRGGRCVVENVESEEYKRPVSAFDGNIWTVIDKLTDQEKISAKESVESAGKGVDIAQLCKRGVGSVVTYGQSVQLMHNLTGLFLSLKRGRLETHTGELEVHLAPPHDATHFFITPGSRAREKGKPVQIHDSIHVVNVGLRFQVTNIPRFEADHRGRTVLVGGSVGTLFRLHRFSVATPLASLTKGDVFGLSHVVHNGLLSMYNCPPAHMEVTAPFLRGTDGVAVHQIPEFWQILGEDDHEGGLLKWQNRVYFKHIATGKFLAPNISDIEAVMKAHKPIEVEEEEQVAVPLLKGLKASAGKLAVGRVGDALKDTFTLEGQAEDDEEQGIDPKDLMITLLSHKEEQNLRLELVDDRCEAAAWKLVSTDLTLDSAKVNNMDPFSDQRVEERGVDVDEGAEIGAEKITPNRSHGPIDRYAVISTDEAVEGMWRMIHVPIERVSEYFTAATYIRRLDELLSVTDASLDDHVGASMMDAEAKAEAAVQAWDTFISLLPVVREKMGDIMLMLLRASAGRAEDAARSSAPECEEFLRTVMGLKIPKSGVELAVNRDEEEDSGRSPIEIAAQLAPVMEEQRIRLQDMLIAEHLFDVLVKLATRLITHPLSPLFRRADVAPKPTRRRQRTAEPDAKPKSDVTCMLLALAETRQQRASADDLETRNKILLGITRGVFLLLRLSVDRNPTTSIAFLPHFPFIMSSVEACEEDVGALRVLHEVFLSNVNLVNMQKTPDIKRWLALCDKRQDLQEDVFTLLTTFCVCSYEHMEKASAGREVNQKLMANLRRIQKLIGALLFSSAHNQLVSRFVGDVTDPNDVFFERGGKRAGDLASLCGVALGRGGDEDQEDNGPILRRHLAILDLSSSLCLGQGSPVTPDVQFSCPLDVMLKVLRHPSATDDVKTRVMEVIRNAYVLTEERNTFAIEYTKYWDEITINERLDGGPPRDEALASTLEWVKQFSLMIGASPPRSRDGYNLLNSVLHCVHALLDVNEFYRVEEDEKPLETVLISLNNLLTLMLSDTIRANDPSVYYAYVQSKLWICRILLKVEDILLDERLGRLFIMYYHMFKGESIDSSDRIMSDYSLQTIIGDCNEAINFLLRIGDFELSKLALLLLLRRHRLVRDTLRQLEKVTILHGEGIGALHAKVSTLVQTLKRNSTSEKKLIGNREVVNEAVGNLLISTVQESLVTDPLKIEGAPSRKAQDLMKRFDIEKIIFKILSVRYQPILHPTFIRCYRFLRFYVTDNLDNQNRLIPFVSLMQVQMGHKLEIAKVFSELFKDNYDLVAGLREHQVLFFCSLLKKEKLPRYAKLLHSLCVVAGNSARRNQLIIANFLRSHKAQTFCLYLTPDDLERRKKLVADDERAHDPTGELEYHAAFIDLLAATCYKRNEACQSVIRTVLGFSDVLDALTDTTLPEKYKGPYWRFLQSVYLDTEPSTLSITERGSLVRLAELLEHALTEVTNSRARIAYVREIRDNLLPTLDHFLSTYINVEAARPIPGTEESPADQALDLDSVEWMRNVVVGTGLLIVSMAQSVVRLAKEMNFPELKDGFYQTLDRLQRSTDIVDMPDDLIKSISDGLVHLVTRPAAGASLLPTGKEIEPIEEEWDIARKKMERFYSYDIDLGEAQLTETICDFKEDNLRRVVAAPLGADIATDIEFILFVLSGVQSLVGFRADWVRRIQLSGLRRSSLSLPRAKQSRSKGAFIRRKTLLGRTIYETPGAGRAKSYKEQLELQEAGVGVEDDEEEMEADRIERERSTGARLKRIWKGILTQLKGGRTAEQIELEREREMLEKLSAGTKGPNKALQTRLNSLGATHTCIVLLSSTQPRVVYNALYASYLLLDAGNLDVQRTVLDAINHGLGSISAALDDFQLLHEINGNFRQVIEEAKSAPWWLSMGSGWKQKDKHRGTAEQEGDENTASGRTERVPAATERSYTPDDILAVSISVIKQLCEGHNIEAQDLLRQQRTSSVNLISSLVQYLDALVPPFIPNPSTSPLLSTTSTVDEVSAVMERLYAPMEQCLDTLMEVIQGPCVGNQQVLMYGLGVETLRDILSLKTSLENAWEDRRPDHEIARTIHATTAERAVIVRACQLLLALLEGPEFWQHIAILCHKNFINPLVAHVNAYGAIMQRFHTKNRAIFETLLDESLPIFMLLCNLQLDPKSSHDHKGARGVTSPDNFMKRVGRIELLRDERTEVVYFSRDSLSRLITEKDRDKIKWGVARSTPAAKIESFQQATEDLYETLRVRREVLSSKVKRGLTNPLFSRLLRALFNAVVIIINVLTVIESAIPGEAFKEVAGFLILFLALFVLIVCLLRWAQFHTLEARVASETKFRAAIRERRKAWAESVAAEAGKPFRIPGFVLNYLKFRFKYISLTYFYHIIMIAAAVLGVTFTLTTWGSTTVTSTGKYWFAIHIIDIMIQSPVLLNVLRSVTKNFQSIALTILLIILVVYFYAIFAFLFFKGVFWKDYEEKPDTPLLCDNILMCWATMMAQLPSQGDFLRERMTYSGEHDSAGPIWEFIFQLSFFFIVMVIVLNILLGIIVDTFSELREARNSILHDMRSKCFVCGLESSIFDREGNGFQNHIKKEHNMWDYLDFFIALMEKYERESETEFDGNESYIYALVNQSPTDTMFYPLSRSLSIERAQKGKVEKKPKVDYERLFQAVQNEMQKLERHLQVVDGDLATKGKIMAIVQEQVSAILNDEGEEDDTGEGVGET